MKINHLRALCTSAAAFVAVMLTAACSDSSPNNEPDLPDPPAPDHDKTEVTVKPKAMWIDCEANFSQLSKKANIDAELKKIKDYGFNMIYLDIKPGNGYALYKSDILPYCNTYGATTVTRDYDDYLGYFLERCEELDIDVIGSLVVMGWGLPPTRQGYVYDHLDEWTDKGQVRSVSDDVTKTVSIIEDKTQFYAMLDPMYPEVQDFVIKVITEVVTKYPKLKGISLDYLRYCNNDGGYYCMSDDNRKAYAEYWGEPVPQRTDFVTATGGQGSKFAKWVEFKSMQVTNMLTKIRTAVKAIRPECEIHLWASSHWESRYAVGQNWASKKFKPVGSPYTDTYCKTGFADQLDVFVTGAYVTTLWKKDDPTSPWSVENFVTSWNDYIMGDCKCYGSLGVYNHNESDMTDATYLCLKHTDGFMAFELSHTNNLSKWASISKAFTRYEKQ